MRTIDHITMGRLTDHVFKAYQDENGSLSYNVNKARIFEHMSVNEFETYKKQKWFYFTLRTLMQLQEIDEDKRVCEIDIEGKGFYLSAQITEKEVLGGIDVQLVDDTYRSEVFSDEQKDILTTWMQEYMKEADEERRCFTGDPYKDYAGHSTFMPPTKRR